MSFECTNLEAEPCKVIKGWTNSPVLTSLIILSMLQNITPPLMSVVLSLIFLRREPHVCVKT